MSKFSETCIKLEARNPSLFRAVQRASLAVAFIFAAAVTGLMDLLWRAIDKQVDDPLFSAVLVGALMLAFIAAAVWLLTSRRD